MSVHANASRRDNGIDARNNSVSAVKDEELRGSTAGGQREECDVSGLHRVIANVDLMKIDEQVWFGKRMRRAQ